MQRDSVGLTNQNNELKFRLQAMEQQAQLRDGTYISFYVDTFDLVWEVIVGNCFLRLFSKFVVIVCLNFAEISLPLAICI